MSTIRVRVLCFSHVRAALSVDELDVELQRGASAGDLVDHVVSLGGEKLGGLPMKIARNEAFVERAEVLADGDVLALIPPVQGGRNR